MLYLHYGKYVSHKESYKEIAGKGDEDGSHTGTDHN